jgi:hypothetical protein
MQKIGKNENLIELIGNFEGDEHYYLVLELLEGNNL